MSRADKLADIESYLLAMHSKPNGVITGSVELSASQAGFLLADATAAAFGIVLPPADRIMDVRVQRVDNTGNRLLVRGSGGEKILFHTHLRPEGYPFFVLMGAGDFWHLRSDGEGSWRLLHRMDTTALGRPVLETTMAFQPGGWAGHNGVLFNRFDWPWLWDHARDSGVLTSEGVLVGFEGCWTNGDGVSTFRCPEARGEHMRVLNEGRPGVDEGRTPGSWQNFSTEDHTHGSAAAAAGTYQVRGNDIPVAAAGNTTGKMNSGHAGKETRARNIAYPGRIKVI